MKITGHNFFGWSGGPPRQIKKNPIFAIILVLFTLAGLFLRIHRLDEQRLWIDEGFSIMQAQAIVKHGIPLLNSGALNFKDIVYGYILGGASLFFGENLWLMRLISVLIGTLTIPLGHWLVARLTNRTMAVLYAGLLAFSYWHIAWSRQIRSYSLLVFLILMSILWLTLYHRRSEKKFLVLAIVTIGLAFGTKIIAGLMFVSLLIFLFFRGERKMLITICVATVIPVLAAWPWIASHFHIMLNNYYAYYLGGYFWGQFGIFFILSLFGAAFAWVADGPNRPIHAFCLSFWIMGYLFLSSLVYVNQFRYAFPFTAIMFFYIVYFLFYFGHFFSQQKKLVAAALLVVAVFFDQRMSAAHPALSFRPCRGNCELEIYTPQPNFAEAYRYLEENIKDNDTLVSAYPYLDRIFMGRAGYALAVSYTGRQQDISVTWNKKEFNSGAPEIDSVGQIIDHSSRGDVYIVLDRMALARMHGVMANFIVNNAEKVHTAVDSNGEEANIFRIGAGAKFFETAKEIPLPLQREDTESEEKATKADLQIVKEEIIVGPDLGPATDGGEIDVEISDADFTEDE